MLSSNVNNNGGMVNLNPVSFASLLKPKAVQVNVPEVPIKPVIMFHSEPNVTWKSPEVKALIVKENLQYEIFINFRMVSRT